MNSIKVLKWCYHEALTKNLCITEFYLMLFKCTKIEPKDFLNFISGAPNCRLELRLEFISKHPEKINGGSNL